MLRELRIENLVLIERADLRLEGGLNVFTGETGAGKTMLAHAIDLLLGGKPRRGAVRPGASEAYVEGLFGVEPGMLAAPEFADLRERLPDPAATELTIARRIGAGGRSRAFIEGRSASAADLAALGGSLITFYGQHEHRKLTLAAAQLALLDGFCGDTQRAGLRRATAAHRRAVEARREIGRLRDLDARRARDIDLLTYELSEIDEAAPDAAVEAECVAERDRLRGVDALRRAASEALATIDADDLASAAGDVPAAATLLATGAGALAGAHGVDERLDALAGRADALALDANELASDLREYLGALADDPARLVELDERLDGFERLKRKHGGTIESVLEYAEHCRAEIARLAGAELALAEAETELSAAEAELADAAGALAKRRRAAAPKLAAAVKRELGDLAMEGAAFEIAIDAAAGDPGPTGGDRVEFMIAPNAGLPPTPLRESASGGELSRVMLALLTAAGAADGTRASLVFDEIDAGIGGQTARAVGAKLRTLAACRQVICITHLAQVAALADRHFRIDKTGAAAGAPTCTAVEQLDGDALVGEICRMMGAETTDVAARRHAEELLAA